jgi:hypothetical protein
MSEPLPAEEKLDAGPGEGAPGEELQALLTEEMAEGGRAEEVPVSG